MSEAPKPPWEGAANSLWAYASTSPNYTCPSILVMESKIREACEAYAAQQTAALRAERDQAAKEIEHLNKALALKLDALPNGLSAGQSMKLEAEREQLRAENVALAASLSRLREALAYFITATNEDVALGSPEYQRSVALGRMAAADALKAATPPPALAPDAQPGKPLIHFLIAGRTPCGMLGVPKEWPEGHVWTYEWKQVKRSRRPRRRSRNE
jgi:hypothetical protein